jgi:very-long-chain enoyl-CoA reductase
MIVVNVELPKGNKLELRHPENSPITDIKLKIQEQTRMPVVQQRLEVVLSAEKRVVLENHKKLNDYSGHIVNNVINLRLKNLGPQIPYRTFFYVEYTGPLITFLFAYLLFANQHDPFHRLITLLVIIHFAKRILEAKFVHIFSNASVPVSVVVRNSLYYWVLFGVLIPFEVYYLRQKPQLWSNAATVMLTLLFLLFQAGNFYCHYALRKLRIRKVNGVETIVPDRSVPTGLFFDSVISPNYSFEILIWVTFAIIFKSFFALFFAIVSFLILKNWASQKKQGMLKMDPAMSSEVKESIRRRFLLYSNLV